MIYKTLQRNLKIGQNEPHLNPVLKSGAPEGYTVPVSYMTPVVLLLLWTR